jgi:hypothetical protein
LAGGGHDSLSVRRAAIWSLVIAAALVIAYFAVQISDYWHAAPGQGANSLMSDHPNETPEQKLEAVRSVVMALPILIAGVALALFIGVLAPVFLLARVVRYLLLPLLPPRR